MLKKLGKKSMSTSTTTKTTKGRAASQPLSNLTNEQLLAKIVSSVEDLIFVIDLDYTVIKIFGKLLDKLKIEQKDMLGKKIYELQPEDFNMQRKDAAHKAFKGKRTQYEWSMPNKNKTIHLQTTISPLYNNKNEIVAALGLVRNITPQKHLEQQKEILLGVASHELKNNLASIKAFTQLLHKRVAGMRDTKAKTYIEKIDYKIFSVTTLIQDLLDMTRIRTEKMVLRKEKFNLERFVNEVITTIQPSLTQHKIIKKGNGNFQVFADDQRIDQVLTNIIRNGVKYSPNGNKIIIHLGKDAKNVILKVQDFGIGIPSKKISTIFLPFTRVENVDKKIPGFGLGLYISSEIVKLHGGKIWVESKEGHGSTFIFTLPLKEKK